MAGAFAGDIRDEAVTRVLFRSSLHHHQHLVSLLYRFRVGEMAARRRNKRGSTACRRLRTAGVVR